MELTLTSILTLLIVGLIIGALARLAFPGPDPIGILGTALIGVGGALLGGFVGAALFGSFSGFGALLLSVLGAVAILAIVRASRRRRPLRY